MTRFLNPLLALFLIAAVLLAAGSARAQYGAFTSVTQFITVQNIDGSFSQVPVAQLVQVQPQVIYNNYSYATPFVTTSFGYPLYANFNSFAYSTPFISSGFFYRPRVSFASFNQGFVAVGGRGFRAAFVQANGVGRVTNHPAAFRVFHPFATRVH